jgi:predicted DNA-binding protein
MLVNVTFSLPDETVKRLREVARRTGRPRKGAISALVDAALNEHLRDVESKVRHEEFSALRGDRTVVKAGSLRELAAILESQKIDPRGVLIVSSYPLEPSVRTGPRRRAD